MNIDDLLILLERSREKIQKIDDDFYIQLKQRIDELSELKRNAGDEEYSKIDEELRTLRRVQKRIFEMRTIKIIHLAWAEVCGTESGIEGRENMIGIEKEFYQDLVQLLETYRRRVVEGDGMEEVRPYQESDRVLVRVRQDIPEFEGVDGKTYKLRKEDVVLIPSLNANALIKSGVAEKIEVKR